MWRWLSSCWFAATMSKVETLCSHLSANSAAINLKDEIAECSVSKIEIPHVLESTFVNLTCTSQSSNWSTERIATVCDTGHLFDNIQSSTKQ